jgi:ABC-type phosphate transport system substrate-binding protein
MEEGWRDAGIKYDSSAGDADLVISLDQHLYPALLPFIQRYGGEKDLKIVVSKGTCGISAGKLTRKEVDIAGFCCPPGKTDRLPSLVFHTIGITPIALLVHSDNPVDNITFEQAREIFQGLVHRWSELRDSGGQAGKNLPIQTIGRLHCKTRPGHWRLLLDNEDLFSPRLQEVGAIPDMISLLSANPLTIGFETMWMVRHHQQEGQLKALKLNGHGPNELDHLLSGDYPIYRTYNITTWKGEAVQNPLALKLADYLLKQAEKLNSNFDVIPASQLRQAGWKFKGDELIGKPR